MPITPFAEATHVVPLTTAGTAGESGQRRFTATVSPAWTIGGRPNGGYLLGLLARAVLAAGDGSHPHVLAASAHYLRSPDPGPVELEVEPLRRGRSASQWRARLLAPAGPCVEALVTTGALTPDSAPTWPAPGAGRVVAPALPAADELWRVPGRAPGGVEVLAMEQVDMRLDPACGGFTTPPTGAGELRGTLALLDADFDPVSLLYAVDAFPPATFDVARSGWVPTLELTAYVRALAAPGPVTVRQSANLVQADLVDETCWVWDSTGRLVAQATQLAGVRFAGT